jgi:hypothetical protein
MRLVHPGKLIQILIDLGNIEGGTMAFRMDIWKYAAALVLIGGLTTDAGAQVIYYEDFADEELVPGTTLRLGAIHDGIVTFTDADAGNRGTLVVEFVTALGAPLAVPTATFSWDVVEPVYHTDPADNEMIIRAGIGTGTNSLSNADHIAEAIVYRTDRTEPIDHTRGDYEDNGQETLFMVVNNQNAPITFPHPGDGSEVMMAAWQTATYVFNAATDAWGVVRGVSNFRVENMANFGDFEKMSIGSSSSGHQGGFGMDNVLIMEGITFERPTIDTGTPGDVDGDDDVDMDDFAIIRSHFQQTVTMRSEGDIAGFDNFVDFRDFRQWKNNAPAPVLAQLAAVPEPSAAVLAGVMVAGLAVLRRRK